MPFICSELPTDELLRLNTRFPVSDVIELFTTEGHLVFHLNGSFYFQTLCDSISNTVEQDLKHRRNYLCTAYELFVPGATVITPILEQFQRRHGIAMRSEIIPLEITFKDKSYILLKLPTRLVRHLMCEGGGALKTVFKGPVGSLRKIPMLSLYGNLPKDAAEDELYKSVFATTYGEGQHAEALKVHYLLLQDVINHPSLGIMVGAVGQWDAD
jgi:hypothetical protein